jgi:hypothetical protein
MAKIFLSSISYARNVPKDKNRVRIPKNDGGNGHSSIPQGASPDTFISKQLAISCLYLPT